MSTFTSIVAYGSFHDQLVSGYLGNVIRYQHCSSIVAIEKRLENAMVGSFRRNVKLSVTSVNRTTVLDMQ